MCVRACPIAAIAAFPSTLGLPPCPRHAHSCYLVSVALRAQPQFRTVAGTVGAALEPVCVRACVCVAFYG